jgi:ribonuclease HI
MKTNGSANEKYYAVIIGKRPGIYAGNTAKKQAIGKIEGGFSRKFDSLKAARRYWNSEEANLLRDTYRALHPKHAAYCSKSLSNGAIQTEAKQIQEGTEKEQCLTCPAAVSQNIAGISLLGKSASAVMIAYTDGSCDPAIGVSGYSVVIPEPDGTMVTIRGALQGQATCSVDAEVAAAKRAALEAKRRGCAVLALHYDCAAVPMRLEAHPEWTEGLAVILVKVRAHSGDTYNSEADRAAKLAMRERRTELGL